MAHHKSAKKRVRSSKRRQVRNQASLSKVRTLVKKVLDTNDPVKAQEYYKEAVSVLDKTVSKGRMHKNTVARKKSVLSKYVNKLETAK